MVTKKPKGLGMGLEALLGPRVVEAVATASPSERGEPNALAIDRLETGRYQPRTRMDEGALFDMPLSTPGDFGTLLANLAYQRGAGPGRPRISRLREGH